MKLHVSMSKSKSPSILKLLPLKWHEANFPDARDGESYKCDKGDVQDAEEYLEYAKVRLKEHHWRIIHPVDVGFIADNGSERWHIVLDESTIRLIRK